MGVTGSFQVLKLFYLGNFYQGGSGEPSKNFENRKDKHDAGIEIPDR